jgi:uncharacterized protein HemY
VSAAAGEDGKALDDYYAALYALDLAGSRDTAPLYEKCGDTEFRRGRYHEAALEYARAIAVQPSASLLEKRAASYEKAGEKQKAAE